GLVVLNAGPRHPRPHPARLASAECVARRLFAEHAAIVLGAYAVIVQIAVAFDRLPDRQPIGCQLGQACAKAGIDIALDHLAGGIDMGVGIENADPVPHPRSTPSAWDRVVRDLPAGYSADR